MPNSKIKQVLPKGKRKKSSGKSSKKTSTKTVASTSSSPPAKEGENRPIRLPSGKFAPGNECGMETRFPPGESGNPKGRPKGLDMTTAFRKVIEKPALEVPSVVAQAERLGMDLSKDPSIRVIDVIMESNVSHIMMGKGDILKQGWERIEGSVKQNIGLNEDDPVMEYLDFMKGTLEPEPPSSSEKKPRVRACDNGKAQKVRVIKVKDNGKP